MEKSKIHSFFTPYFPDHSSQKLVIPAAFIVRIDKALPVRAKLRNGHGRCWQVKVVRTSNCVFFKNGWESFVKDNTIQIGEFIVFRYDGDHIFDFIILGRCACEKNNAMIGGNTGKGFYVLKEEQNGKDRDRQKKVISEEEENGGDDDIEYKLADEDDDDDDEEYDEEEEQEKPKACGSGHKREGRNEEKQPFKIENCDGIELEEYIDFKNPYFITQVQPRRAKLFIPTEVIEVFKIKLQHKSKMFFRNTNGRECPGEVTVWKDGRVWIKGWNSFCRWNRLTVEDRCICELILDMGFIQVHIIRAGDS